MSFPPSATAWRPSISTLAVVFLASGCPTRDQILPGDGGGGTSGDGGGAPAIAIVSPMAMSYVTGTAQVEVRVTGGSTTQVQLLRNDMPWQTLSGSSFAYPWVTGASPEGDYILTAKATVGGMPEGHGLGLAVSQNIVLEHGGRIVVQNRPSREGRGATFEVQLPVVR